MTGDMTEGVLGHEYLGRDRRGFVSEYDFQCREINGFYEEMIEASAGARSWSSSPP